MISDPEDQIRRMQMRHQNRPQPGTAKPAKIMALNPGNITDSMVREVIKSGLFKALLDAAGGEATFTVHHLQRFNDHDMTFERIATDTGHAAFKVTLSEPLAEAQPEGTSKDA